MTKEEKTQILEECHWMLLKNAAELRRSGFTEDRREFYQIGALAILEALATQREEAPVAYSRLKVRLRGAIIDFIYKQTGGRRKELTPGEFEDLLYQEPPIDPEEMVILNEEETLWKNRELLLPKAIDSLPEQEREVILRHYYRREYFNAIGRALNKSNKTVWKYHNSALEHLRNVYSGAL